MARLNPAALNSHAGTSESHGTWENTAVKTVILLYTGEMNKRWNVSVWILLTNTSELNMMRPIVKLLVVNVLQFLTVLLVLSGNPMMLFVHTEIPVLIKNTTMRNNRDVSGMNNVLTHLTTFTMNVLKTVPNST